MPSYCDFVREIREGMSEVELTEELNKLVAEVRRTLKPGTITHSITITPRNEDTVMVTDKISSKAPEGPRDATTFYMAENDQLQRQKPKQGDLELFERRPTN